MSGTKHAPEAAHRPQQEAAAPAEYPRMLFHPDGSTLRVNSAEEAKQAGQGWSDKPSDVHLQPRAANVIASGWEPQALMMREVLEDVLDQRGLGKSRAQRAEEAKQQDATPRQAGVESKADPGERRTPPQGQAQSHRKE